MEQSRDERYGITKEFLRSIFDYVDGRLVWKKHKRAVPKMDRKGYVTLYFSEHDCPFFMHRLIWIYHNGAIPIDKQIDHIDRDRANNKIENLRVVTSRENCFNKNPGVTGFRGVSWNKVMCKYQARYSKGAKVKSIGYFDTPEAASLAYKEAIAMLS